MLRYQEDRCTEIQVGWWLIEFAFHLGHTMIKGVSEGKREI